MILNLRSGGKKVIPEFKKKKVGKYLKINKKTKKQIKTR
jgi:hypothetical protein